MSSTTATSSPSYISSPSSSSNNADAWRKTVAITVAICIFMVLVVGFIIARIFQQYRRRMNAKKLDAAHNVDLEAATQRTQSFDWDEKRRLSGDSVTCPPPAYITTTSSLDGDSGAITPEQRLRALDTFFGGAPLQSSKKAVSSALNI